MIQLILIIVIAKVIGIDPVADLALLQLELDPDLPPPTYLEIEQESSSYRRTCCGYRTPSGFTMVGNNR